MPTRKGKSQVEAFFAKVPQDITMRVLRGAGRAAANVIADEARARSISPEVSAAIRVRTRIEGSRIVARVQVAMANYNLPLWLEYGTDPHFISVDDSQRAGMSVRKVNDGKKAGTLTIGGKPVGATVWHPGSQDHPFLRPALDIKEADAIRAAQHYVSTRVTKIGIIGQDEGDQE